MTTPRPDGPYEPTEIERQKILRVLRDELGVGMGAADSTITPALGGGGATVTNNNDGTATLG